MSDSPFKVLYGYNPDFTISPNSTLMVPTADERLNEIKNAQKDAKAMLEIANENIKHFYDKGVKDAPEYKTIMGG